MQCAQHREDDSRKSDENYEQQCQFAVLNVDMLPIWVWLSANKMRIVSFAFSEIETCSLTLGVIVLAPIQIGWG
jgi:hypothetical protein